MIDVAAEAGADYVKFQTFKAETLVNRSAVKAEYQKKRLAGNETQFEMIKKLELNQKAHFELFRYTIHKGIKFLSSAFDHESIDFLATLNPILFKIPSGEITNLPYLRHIGGLGYPLIISTGMANLDEVELALKIIIRSGTKKDLITVLHCNTEYPTQMVDVNLRAMLTMRDEFGVKVGYSDHTLGVEIPIAAVALGATVIEKHFTLDRTQPGPDHKASLEPHELKLMVSSIRNIEKSMGDGIKRPSPSELKNIHVARKSIVAKQAIKKGEVFSVENLTVKRPGEGISPMKWDDLLGLVSTNNYNTDDLIVE
jgi:N,N'-diacetyllegionaminate synthase